MKTIVKATTLIIMVVATINVAAQSKLKLGYINSDSLMLVMPGLDSANALLKLEYTAYQTKVETMQKELDVKVAAYVKDSATMLPSIKTMTLTELNELNTRIKTFSATADSSFRLRRVALIKPIQEKAVKAIEAVAKENGYTYIFDSAIGFLLYKSESYDVMPLVRKKLGIK